MNDTQSAKTARSRLTLILLVLVFIMPVALAYLFYKNPEWQPTAGKNYGTLYKPPIVLDEFTLQTAQGEEFAIEQLRGKWSLIYIGSGGCEQACKETLYKASAARVAQGVDAGRINVYYLLAGHTFRVAPESLMQEYPGLIALQGEGGERERLIARFALNPEHLPGQDDRLYLIDPLGNLIMHYSYGFRDLWLMEDLKHLLKWSQIG